MGDGQQDRLYTPEEYKAARAEVAMLREGLGKLVKCFEVWSTLPDPTEWPVKPTYGLLVAVREAISALSTPAADWLERQIAEKDETIQALRLEAFGLGRRLGNADCALEIQTNNWKFERARAEKAEAERDGLANFVESLKRGMSGSAGYVHVEGVVPGSLSSGPDVNASYLAARDARIKAEARKAALLEAAAQWRSEFGDGDRSPVGEWLARRAGEVRNA